MKTINLKHFTKNIGKVVQENSPTILTALGVVGVAATGYFAVKAGFESQKKIEDERYSRSVARTATEPDVVVSTRDRVELIWKLYIPAVTTGVMTVGCIIAANRIQVRRMAALAGAYAVISGDFDEYREKAQELLGVKKSAELEEKHAKAKIDKVPPPGTVLQPGQTWFCDMSTMRYFPSTMETIKAAQNAINYKLNNQSGMSLNNFYEHMDLETTDKIGDMLGWEPGEKIELDFTPILTDQYGAVTAFKFKHGGLPKFWDLK